MKREYDEVSDGVDTARTAGTDAGYVSPRQVHTRFDRPVPADPATADSVRTTEPVHEGMGDVLPEGEKTREAPPRRARGFPTGSAPARAAGSPSVKPDPVRAT